MQRPLFASPFALVVCVVCMGACGSSPPETIGIDGEAATWNAYDYCRTTTCSPSPAWPQSSACEPADWASQCANEGKWDVPVWWRTACVGYDVQKGASKRVSLSDAEAAAKSAFTAWSGAACAGGGSPSIDARDLGPVDCASASYDPNGPNQNVIAFDDDAWPHGSGGLTIALTTVTFVPRTGELRDADIEINEANHDVRVLSRPAADAYDLQVVLTHESGHFLGLAHSSNPAAVMFASDEGSSFSKRALNASDVKGICAIYPPHGTRGVSTLVDASGAIAEGSCDPTPHGGLGSSCP